MLWDGTHGFSSLSEKTRKSNRLQTSWQRQHFLLSYLKTLSVARARVRTHDLLLSQQTGTLPTEPTTHLTTATPFNFNHSPTTVQSNSAFRISSDNIVVPSSLRNCFIYECDIVNQEFQNCTTCYGELRYWRGRQWKTGCDNAPPVYSGDLSDALL